MGSPPAPISFMEARCGRKRLTIFWRYSNSIMDGLNTKAKILKIKVGERSLTEESGNGNGGKSDLEGTEFLGSDKVYSLETASKNKGDRKRIDEVKLFADEVHRSMMAASEKISPQEITTVMAHLIKSMIECSFTKNNHETKREKQKKLTSHLVDCLKR